MEISSKIKYILTQELNNLENIENIYELNKFQAENKYLFMAIYPKVQVELWRIIALYDKENFFEIFDTYKNKVQELEKEEIENWKILNSISHIFWYFKTDLNKNEKQYFLSEKNIENLLKLLEKYANKFDSEYILKQSILKIN